MEKGRTPQNRKEMRAALKRATKSKRGSNFTKPKKRK